MSSIAQFEFSQEQNKEITDLAGKMRFVGLISLLFGLFALLITVLVLAFIFRDRLPPGFRAKAKDYLQKVKEKIPDDLKQQAEEYSLDKVPTDNSFLWGVGIFSGVTGLIFTLQGGWSRSAAASFQKIADTKGSDITHLMRALGSLRSMYGMVSSLLTLAIVAAVIAIGLTVYHYVS